MRLRIGLVHNDLMVARPRKPNGYTWTLASQLGRLLHEAENHYGPRDKAFTILGVEFRDGRPQIWLPEFDSGKPYHVIVQLERSAMRNPNQAMYQLAQECIHLLAPSSGCTNVLEEGVATFFSLKVGMDDTNLHTKLDGVGTTLIPDWPNYAAACLLYQELLSLRVDIVKELRRLHGPLKTVTVEQIVSLCPDIDIKLAEKLICPFDYKWQ